MTDWKTVYGSCEPSTLDTTSSSFVVYQRKNISRRGTFIWQYEERKLTREEYSMILIDSKLDSDATAVAAFKDSSGNVISDTYATKTALSAGLNSKLDSDATAAAAFKDSAGNVISDTYVTKSELNHKLNAVRYGYRIRKDEADPDLRVEYLYDAIGMRPAHMVWDTDTATAGTDSDTSYFDYGDWQNVWFVKDNKPLMLNPDGTVAYYLNPNDYSLKEDGTTSDIADTSTSLNAMAQIPLCWIYRYEDNNYLYEIVSNVQWDENYKAYAHTDSAGQIKDYFYNAIYRYSGSSSKIRSLSGQPHIKLSFVQSFAAASANGSDWTLPSWSQNQLIRNLLFLLGKSTHILDSFGNVNSAWSGGGSESLDKLAPNGEGNTRGQFFGFSHTRHKFQRKIFHSETYNGCIYLVGLFNDRLVCKLKMTPPYATAPDNSYITYGTIPSVDTAFISAATVNDFGLFPTAFQGSDSTFYCCSTNWHNDASVDNAISKEQFSFVLAHQPISTVRAAMGSALSYV